MIHFLIKENKSLAKEIIIEQIKNNKSLYSYPEFAENARYFKEDTMINVLFKRLEKTDNAYIYYPIIETIIYYNDTELNKRMIEIITKNDKINDWGLEKVEKLLNKNNLKIE